MYFIKNGAVYVKDGEVYKNVGISVLNPDPVMITETLKKKSISVTNGTVTTDTVDAGAYTIDEVIAKLHISEDSPLDILSE